jgi:hypothetical protein
VKYSVIIMLIICSGKVIDDCNAANKDEHEGAIKKINYIELNNSKVKLIGILGQPLQQFITIHGQWQYPESIAKEGGLDMPPFLTEFRV